VCTNVVNLIIGRSLARAREMEIRSALGAGLADIVRQLLAEALLLCVAGGALGLLLAAAVLRGLPIILKQTVDGLAIDARALAFASLVCLLVTLLCALAPALSTNRRRRPFRLRQGLVVGQIALSLVLLLSAAAFLRVFLKLVDRSPGFESSHVYYFGFGLPEGHYTDRQMVDFHARLRARLAEIPGVEAAGAVWRRPLSGRNLSTTFQFEGAGLPSTEWPAVEFNMIDPAYFPALRIPLLEGRRLDWDTDRLDRPPALVVNRTFEKTYGPHEGGNGGGLVGKRVQLRFWTDVAPRNQLWQIVGVVGDTYQMGLDQPIRPQIYLPVSQTGLDGGKGNLLFAAAGRGSAVQILGNHFLPLLRGIHSGGGLIETHFHTVIALAANMPGGFWGLFTPSRRRGGKSFPAPAAEIAGRGFSPDGRGIHKHRPNPPPGRRNIARGCW